MFVVGNVKNLLGKGSSPCVCFFSKRMWQTIKMGIARPTSPEHSLLDRRRDRGRGVPHIDLNQSSSFVLSCLGLIQLLTHLLIRCGGKLGVGT